MKVVSVSDADLAFPARGAEMLPDEKLVTPEFLASNAYKKWSALFHQLFYSGSPPRKKLELYPKEGADSDAVWRMICCAMGTYGCKHERKVEGVAFMFDYFFKDYAWVPEKKEEAM